MKKLIIIVVIIGVVIGFFAFDLNLLFTLKTSKPTWLNSSSGETARQFWSACCFLPLM